MANRNQGPVTLTDQAKSAINEYLKSRLDSYGIAQTQKGGLLTLSRPAQDAINVYLKDKLKSYWTYITVAATAVEFIIGNVFSQYISWKVAINTDETSKSLRKAYEDQFAPLKKEADGDREQIDQTQVRVALREGELNILLSLLKKKLEVEESSLTLKEKEIQQITQRINALTVDLGQAESRLKSLSGLQSIQNVGNLVDQIYDKLSKSKEFVDRFSLLPVGSVIAYSGPIVELPDWMECDGRQLSIKDYGLLYERLGKGLVFGQAEDKFRIPDYRGLFLRGLDTTSRTDTEAARRTSQEGEIVGARVGSKQDDEVKGHQHQLQIKSAGTHVHSLSFTAAVDGRGGDLDNDPHGANNQRFDVQTSPSGEHTHEGVAVASGGTESRPKNVAVYWIIKVR